MIGHLQFNLPEERDEHLTAVHAMDLKIIIDEIGSKLRSLNKWGDKRELKIELIRKQFWEIINDSPARVLFY